ncbi:hypothetical protein DH2020_031123 [Rehmannia glutinosa]|uniref:Uncharacterized protein n=1 Tax=Rehmannia glutinosa TaxID=99300 RepID=A0ABR0VMA8_REHGL
MASLHSHRNYTTNHNHISLRPNSYAREKPQNPGQVRHRRIPNGKFHKLAVFQHESQRQSDGKKQEFRALQILRQRGLNYLQGERCRQRCYSRVTGRARSTKKMNDGGCGVQYGSVFGFGKKYFKITRDAYKNIIIVPLNLKT